MTGLISVVDGGSVALSDARPTKEKPINPAIAKPPAA